MHSWSIVGCVITPTNGGFHETRALRVAIFSDVVGDRRERTRAEEPSTKGTPSAHDSNGAAGFTGITST